MQVPHLPAHLTEFTLGELDGATARRDETAEQRTKRIAAIRAMYEAYRPRDGIEDTLVGQIIAMRFMVADAMKRLASMPPDTEDEENARKSAATLNRILLSWVRQLEQGRTREAKLQAASAREQATPRQDRPIGTLRLSAPAAPGPGANGTVRPAGTLTLPAAASANGVARPPGQQPPPGAGASTQPAGQPAGQHAGGPVRPQQANVAAGSQPNGSNARPAGSQPNGAGPRPHATTT
jgi:hypothetical protein